MTLAASAGVRPASHRLVIFEGIMGSGKSTHTKWLAARLHAAGQDALALTEAAQPHPIRAADDLTHWFQPWRDVTVAEYIERSIAKWQAFVANVERSTAVHVVDGQLFHGDLTNLFLMEADLPTLAAYNQAVAAAIAPLGPLLVYFHQQDVAQAIRIVCAERGEAWVKYQVDWKLQGPYALRRQLVGLDGLIALYRDYRAVTDPLFAGWPQQKLSIENSGRDWAAYRHAIEEATGLAPQPAA